MSVRFQVCWLDSQGIVFLLFSRWGDKCQSKEEETKGCFIIMELILKLEHLSLPFHSWPHGPTPPQMGILSSF